MAVMAEVDRKYTGFSEIVIVAAPRRTRGLDSLPVKLADKAGAKEILVKFERFKGGIAEKKVDE